MKRDRVDLRLRGDEKAQWEKKARELGLSLSEFIRRAVSKLLNER